MSATVNLAQEEQFFRKPFNHYLLVISIDLTLQLYTAWLLRGKDHTLRIKWVYMTWKYLIRKLQFSKFLKIYSRYCSKFMYQIDTALGVLHLMLIVYYMTNLSREELSIIFVKSRITILIKCIPIWPLYVPIWPILIFAFKKTRKKLHQKWQYDLIMSRTRFRVNPHSTVS